jgi:hypothetical protein
MHHAQTVSEMAEDVLTRQAKAQAARTGKPLGVALAAILQATAGRQLQGLRDGSHRHEEADEWQEAINEALANIITIRYRNCFGSLDRPRNMSL